MSTNSLRIFILAGEASGDIYGAQVASELQKLTDVELKGWGGERMVEAGVSISKHYKELAFMGFVEVVKNLRTISRNLSTCWSEIEEFKPDAIITVDFPGFNMRIAKKAKKNGLKVFQVVSPQVWAWKAGRVVDLARDFEAVYPVLPFEREILEKGGVSAHFMGHPLLDELETRESKKGGEKLLALLPGSRKQELEKMLPTMIEVAKKLQHYTPVIAGAPGLSREDYKLAIKAGIEVAWGNTRMLLAKSELAIITSGTATLEAALLGVKHIIVYKTSAINYAIAKAVVNVKHIGLPNLIAGKQIVPELIQGDCSAESMMKEFEKLENSNSQIEEFNKLREKLGSSGASRRIAAHILSGLS